MKPLSSRMCSALGTRASHYGRHREGALGLALAAIHCRETRAMGATGNALGRMEHGIHPQGFEEVRVRVPCIAISPAVVAQP